MVGGWKIYSPSNVSKSVEEWRGAYQIFLFFFIFFILPFSTNSPPTSFLSLTLCSFLLFFQVIIVRVVTKLLDWLVRSRSCVPDATNKSATVLCATTYTHRYWHSRLISLAGDQKIQVKLESNAAWRTASLCPGYGRSRGQVVVRKVIAEVGDVGKCDVPNRGRTEKTLCCECNVDVGKWVCGRVAQCVFLFIFFFTSLFFDIFLFFSTLAFSLFFLPFLFLPYSFSPFSFLYSSPSLFSSLVPPHFYPIIYLSFSSHISFFLIFLHRLSFFFFSFRYSAFTLSTSSSFALYFSLFLYSLPLLHSLFFSFIIFSLLILRLSLFLPSSFQNTLLKSEGGKFKVE